MSDLGRKTIQEAVDRYLTSSSHVGWWLDYGRVRWASEGGARGKDTQQLISQAIDLSAKAVQKEGIYDKAYQRWEQATKGTDRHAIWEGALRGRLLTGIGQADDHPRVLLHHSYGVPTLHGSQLKGLALNFARSTTGRSALGQLHGLLNTEKQQTAGVEQILSVLFGQGSTSAGYLIFHDAWWVPGSAEKPLVAEVLTPHHQTYFATQGQQPPSDMESPIPSQLLAVRGAFRFVVEGPMPWAGWGLSLLRAALETQGAGARTHADYGLFKKNPTQPAR